MKANQLRRLYIDFFTASDRGHQAIPSAPLIPLGDATTLFNSAGMQPLVPYLMGQTHPLGKRLVNSQLSFRAEDIDEVGDNRHTTFFEMLGNWSLGDYFKTEQLAWFFEFLTQVVKLDPKRLYVTVFAGNEAVVKDDDSIKIWQELFKTDRPAQSGEQGFDPQVKIYSYPADKNWWSRSGVPANMPVGEIGGPDSEVFFDFDPDNKLKIHQQSKFSNQPCHLNCDCGRFLEIGNSVFMEYQKQADGSLKQMDQRNVDFGGGLERILAAANDQPDIFQTNLFQPIIQVIETTSGQVYKENQGAMRVIADHLRAAVFMIKENLEPSNKGAGYILRRLLRRAAVKMRQLKGQMKSADLVIITDRVVEQYQASYFNQVKDLKNNLAQVIGQEINKFSQSLDRGLKEIAKRDPHQVDCQFAFDLFQSYGFPFEITQEILETKGCKLDRGQFDQLLSSHQRQSRTASKGMFKSGLADNSEAVTKLHTATHLLHAALRQVLGDQVQQVGSNITAARLRFDFTYDQKLTPEQLTQVEDLINQQIDKDLKVDCQTMALAEAKKSGALAFFGQKYPAKVKVYSVKDFSKELCTGPHVDSTGQIGGITIVKEESCGAGKRRIYAQLRS